MLHIEFKLKQTFIFIISVLIVINFILTTNATFQKRQDDPISTCRDCREGCVETTNNSNDLNICLNGCSNGPDCQGVNAEACENCLDGCCRIGESFEGFVTCADGACNVGPVCQGVIETYSCQAIQTSLPATVSASTIHPTLSPSLPPTVSAPATPPTSSPSLPKTATEAEIATTTTIGRVLTPTPIPPNANVITTETTTTSYFSGYITTNPQGLATTISPSKIVVVENVAIAKLSSPVPNSSAASTRIILQDFNTIYGLLDITISLAIVTSYFVFTLLF